MEDYAGAFEARCQDVTSLLVDPQRTIGAAHLGGVAIECQLKALMIKYHDIEAWGDLGGRPKDPMRSQPIERPGHGLISMLRLMHFLHAKARSDVLFLRHLARINNPSGPTNNDFIDLRYSAGDLPAGAAADWHLSYKYVIGWLKKNGEVV